MSDDAIDQLKEELAEERKKSQRLAQALKILYEETADYIRINNLGDVHHNQSMKGAREALHESGQ